MKLLGNAKLISAVVFSMALAACASTDYVSQLSQPNFGRWVPPSVSLDPAALMYGPLAPRPSQVPCYTAAVGRFSAALTQGIDIRPENPMAS
jgi:hypothetical protein